MGRRIPAKCVRKRRCWPKVGWGRREKQETPFSVAIVVLAHRLLMRSIALSFTVPTVNRNARKVLFDHYKFDAINWPLKSLWNSLSKNKIYCFGRKCACNRLCSPFNSDFQSAHPPARPRRPYNSGLHRVTSWSHICAATCCCAQRTGARSTQTTFILLQLMMKISSNAVPLAASRPGFGWMNRRHRRHGSFGVCQKL